MNVRLFFVAGLLCVAACDRKSERSKKSTVNHLEDSDLVRDRSVPIVEKGTRFSCTPTEVWDGDGPIWCKEGPRVRLAGVAAREIDGTCRTNQPCPPMSGVDARDQLAGLLGRVVGKSKDGHILVQGPTMECVSEGGGKGSRTAAWCVSPAAGDVSCRLVAKGSALVWSKYWRDHVC